MRKETILSSILLLILLSACASPISDQLFRWTGEEEPLPQLRGVLQLMANVLHPRPETADETPIAHSGVNPFGINVFLNQEVEPAKRERSIQMIADAGFRWLRQEFPWEDIEIHGKGDFIDRRNDVDGDGTIDAIDAWAKYDQIVDLAEQYGLEVVPRLSNPPAWSRAEGNAAGAYAPPDDLDDWGDYVYTTVSRYKGRVRYYQLWNEPNVYPEWGEQPVDPEAFTQLLCEGYRRAQAADPDVTIISGALAQTVSLNPGPGPALGMNEFVFLQRMYDAGAADCFDVMAVNDYMLWSGPTDLRLQPDTINYSRPLYVRGIMVANGDAEKPIWISEMNANAVPNDPTIQGVGAYGQVTLEQQARYAPLAYQRAMEEWPWAGVVNFWFFKRPSDAERNQAMYYFRMVEPDFTPLPVYDAMRQFTANLRPTLYPGVHQADHWAVSATGGWETVGDAAATLGSYQRATTPEAAMELRFEGTSLRLTPGPGRGQIDVQVDEGSTRRISLEGRPVTLARSWRVQPHTLTLTAASGEVTVDQLTVGKSHLPSLRVLAYGALLALGVALILILRRR